MDVDRCRRQPIADDDGKQAGAAAVISEHAGGVRIQHASEIGTPQIVAPVGRLTGNQDRQLIELNDALNELAEADPRKARVVELRYFGGLSVKETAAVLKVSEETITRDWRIARSWLLSEMNRA